MEFDLPGFDKPKEPPGFGNPQVEVETLNPNSSKETQVKGPEILMSSGSETGRQEPQRSPTKIVGSDTGSEKSFQTASTDRNELAKWQAQRIKEQIAKQSQRAKSEAPNPQLLSPEKGSDAPAYSTRSHSRAATESPKKSGQTPEKTQFGLPVDLSSTEKGEKQSKTGTKASSKTKSGQKVQPKKAETQASSSKKAQPPPQKQTQKSGLTPQMGIQTLQSQETQPETSQVKKVEKPKTYYPDFTHILNFLNDEEVENLKAKSTAWIKQTTQIALNDLTYGKCGGIFVFRHTKSTKGVVDIHPERVQRVRIPETKESLYLVTIDPMVKSGLQQRFYGSNTARSAQNEPLPYPEFWKRVDEMVLAKHLIWQRNRWLDHLLSKWRFTWLQRIH